MSDPRDEPKVERPGGSGIPDDDETRTVLSAPGVAAGDLLAGRYRLRVVIGRGGMGLVYRATDERLGLDVALKLLRPEHGEDDEVAARFTREILLARQVSHRNVVRIHDLGEDPELGLSFLTMDLVEGRSLKHLLAEEGRFGPARAAALVAQLADGLAAAHREGVVHRDLKPSNVLVDPEGQAYVTDFGIARSLTGGALTRTGGIVGTPAYLSPEQARGEAVDARSDVYSLGLILYEMLAGVTAFPEGTFTEMVSHRIAGRPRDLAERVPDVPGRLLEVVRRCLRRDPEERYPDAGALAAALAGFLPTSGEWSETGGWSEAEAGGGSRRRWWRGRPAWWAAAGLAVVAAAAWALLLRLPPVPKPESAPSEAASPVAARHALAILPLAVGADGADGADGAAAGGGADTPLAAAQILERHLIGGPAGGLPDVRLVDTLRTARTLADLGLPGTGLRDPDLRQLADLLGADRVVQGRVVPAPPGIRVEGRLSSVTAAGVESEELAVRGSDLVAALDAFAAELRRRLSPETGAGTGGGPEPGMSRNPAALRAYEGGLDALVRGDAVAAVPALEEAVNADPGFAAAWVYLADARASLGRYEAAADAARRAIAELPDGGRRDRLGYRARAQLASLRGEPEEAAALLARLAQRFPGDLEARVDHAEASIAAGGYAEAATALERVTEVDPNHPRAWFLLGKVAILTGDYRRAADDYLIRALTIQNRLGSPQGRADAENALGIALLNLGQLEAAQRHLGGAAALRREIGDRRGTAATLSNLGLVESQRGRYRAARQAFEESLAIRREIGDGSGVASLYNSLGFLEEEQGTYRQALSWYRRGLEQRRAGGDPRAVAESLNNVGYAYFLLGDMDNSAVYWDRALEIYQGTDNPEGVLVTRQNLGLLDLARGDWGDALEAFLETLASARSLGLLDAEAVSLGHLGRVAQWQGRYPAAFAAYREALERVGEVGDPRGLAEFHLMAAGAALEAGWTRQAAASLEAAAGWLEEGGNRGQRGEMSRLRGVLAAKRGATAEAERHLDAAAAAAEASGSQSLALATRLARADLELARTRGGAAAARRALALAGGVAEEAAASGLRPVEVLALEGVAAAHLAAGSPSRAAGAAAEALAAARDLEPYGRSYRLHRLRAAALEADSGGGGEGTGAAAEAAWDEAARELARIRAALAPADGGDDGADDGATRRRLEAALERVPAVVAIDRRRPPAAGPGGAGGGEELP